MSTSLHAHVETYIRDCDGSYYSEYVMPLSAEEVDAHVKADGVNDFHDIYFKERILSSVVALHTHAKIEITPEGFTYGQPTEEGFRNTEVVWCEDESCDPRASEYRDFAAEAMGY